MLFLPIIGLLIGILLGYLFPPIDIPLIYNRYISVSFLAGLDSAMGAWRAGLENKFCLSTFIIGFTTNALLAGFLTYAGDRLGVDFYLAVIVTFGVRLFNNFAGIRRILWEYFSKKKNN